MFYRVRKYLSHRKFYSEIVGLLNTPPLVQREAPLAIVSMVQETDVRMYILAIKALYRRMGGGHIVVIPDADVSQSSRDLIRGHLGDVEFVTPESIPTGSCQRGGTWERVLYCVDRSAQEYVIQIDADVLCFGEIPEVIDCVRTNRAFTIAEGLAVKPLPEWVEDGIARKSDHIVTTFELKAREFPNASRYQYVRGSSGFAGFAKGKITRAFLEEFHAGGVQVHGSRWTEWGTEQIASNFTAANSSGVEPLPYPKYATFEPDYATYQRQGIPQEHSVLHFIGSHRFELGTFVKLANREIEALKQQAVPAGISAKGAH